MTVDNVLTAELATGRVVTAVRPGVVMLCPDGWSGSWEVDETIRKTYVIVRTESGSD